MQYRKKPVVVEAEQYHAEVFLPPGGCVCSVWRGAHVHTLEGTSYALTDGDWIIKGIAGEFYPCKPDIFEQTYEPV